MALPEPGQQVIVVVAGGVMRVDETTGLFDVDYGPGWLVAAERMLLEESSVVRGLVEYARRGVVWKLQGPGGSGWRCPRCRISMLDEEKAARGEVCEECRERIAIGDVAESIVDMALDSLADHLIDAGVNSDKVWRVLEHRRDEIKQDFLR